MPKWFGRSIKTQLTVLFFALTAISIVIIGFLGIRGILASGTEAEKITTSSMQERAEQFLEQTATATASKNSLIFTNIQHQGRNAAEYVRGLLDNPSNFPSSHWRYDGHIYRLPAGQYTNSSNELSSVFMHKAVSIDSQLKRELELTSYMDYYAPQMLKDESNAVAVYFIGLQGEARYYPNIGLASVSEPNFNPTSADFFFIADPTHDPDKSTKTTDVYDDPAGNGLMITVTSPVYKTDGRFVGVIGIDVILSNIANNIKDYSPIESSYAILIDNNGKAIALPDQGYKDILGRSAKKGEFGANLKDVKNGFAPVLKEMMTGKMGFKEITANNTHLYAAFSPVVGTSFSLGIIAKQDSLLKVVGDLRSQVTNSTNAVLYFQILPIAVAVLGLFWFFGYMYIRILTRPLIELTAETRKIMQGDFQPSNVHVKATNEIGNLAAAFNKMTAELSTSYQVLQRQVHELADGKAKDDAMLNSIGDGVIVTDSAGKVLLVNAVAATLLGVEGSSIINRPLTDLTLYDTGGEEIASSERPLFVALKTGKKIEREVQTTKEKGVKRELRITASPVTQEGKVVGSIEIIRDITKEKEVDRMKTDFIAIASHQLRTPLSAIRWFGEMLAAGDAGKLKPEQQEFVGNITQSTKRMIELVGSLLNISRLESGRVIVDPQPTDLKQLIQNVVDELKTDITDRRQKIEIDIDASMPKVSIDSRLVSQVYMNLLTNAIKYTPNSGRIDIRVVRKGNEIISEVKDSGYGIPRGEQVKIFDRFFRASNIVKVETDGTGLGLYLIKVIVESSGGRVWFESEEGKGTTFWFTLPLGGMQPKSGDALLDA